MVVFIYGILLIWGLLGFMHVSSLFWFGASD